MKLVTLCSGGLDSVVLAYHIQNLGYQQVLLFVNYGQENAKEYLRARQCAKRLEVQLEYATVRGSSFKSTLMDSDVVPNRNAVMANLAASLAVSLEYDGIALAVHYSDYTHFPDCRPEFIVRLHSMLKAAIDQPEFVVYAPFLHWRKYYIVRAGKQLGVPFGATWSCYEGGEFHCGTCKACCERRAAFAQANVEDPTAYKGDK